MISLLRKLNNAHKISSAHTRIRNYLVHVTHFLCSLLSEVLGDVNVSIFVEAVRLGRSRVRERIVVTSIVITAVARVLVVGWDIVLRVVIERLPDGLDVV